LREAATKSRVFSLSATTTHVFIDEVSRL
jgi:hypothetical protein